MLKRKSAAAAPARKPRKSARKRITKGQVRTNVVIDRELVEKAKAKARVRTAREAIHAALENYVKPYDYSGILALRGTGCIAEDYDPGAGGAAKFLGGERVHEPLAQPDAGGREGTRIVQRRSVK
jgi:Arc/MetJ family transcription regulator